MSDATRSVVINLGVKPDLGAAQAGLRGVADLARQAGGGAKGLGAELKGAGAAGEKLTGIQKELNASFEAGQRRLALLNAMLDPAEVKRRVEQTLQLEAAQARLNAALETELATRRAADDKRSEAGKRFAEELRAEREEAKKLNAELGAKAKDQGALGGLGSQVGGRLGGLLKTVEKVIKGLEGVRPGQVVGGIGGPGGLGGGVPKSVPGLGFVGQGGGLEGLLGGATDGAGLLEGAMGGGAGGIGALGGAAAAAGPALVALAAAAGAAAIAWKGIGLASPGTVDRFQMALEDTTAVLGERMVPVMDFLTEVVRDVGDVLANILPDTSDVKGLMNELRPVLNEIKDEFMALAPVVKDVFVAGLRAAAYGLHALNEVLKPLFAAAKDFREMLGLTGPENAKTQMGTAIRDVKYNDVRDIGKDLALRAIRANQPGDAQEQAVGLLEQMNNTLSEINGWLKALHLPEFTANPVKAAGQGFLGSGPLFDKTWDLLAGGIRGH